MMGAKRIRGIVKRNENHYIYRGKSIVFGAVDHAGNDTWNFMFDHDTNREYREIRKCASMLDAMNQIDSMFEMHEAQLTR
jgi:hypothetical protein